ncbi:MAG: SDR family oxidoreductase, partial [Bacteroidia bacterium]|nr:SDR family oxidoreductase [Bacteroidia bacterium]
KNKIVIITGASSGIGKACAFEFASKGCKVVIAARNKPRLEELANQIDSSGENVLAVQTDITDENACRRLVEQTIRKFGALHVLINNAGISMRASFAEVKTDVLKQIMDVNFWGAVYCTKYAIPHLLETQGSVVGVSSIAGKKGLPGRVGYSSSKFAMEGMLESIRVEYLKRKLHVLTVCPGFTESEIREHALTADGSQQSESPRDEQSMMTAEEVAKHIFNGVVKRKRQMILGREGKLTVFLNKIIPGRLDKMVYKHMKKEDNSPF